MSYWDHGMSDNARAAYERGLLPASQAARRYGFRSAGALAAVVQPAEWHHTSRYFRRTNFYDIPAAVRLASWQQLAKWKSAMTARGWKWLRGIIREKMRKQMTPVVPRHPHRKSRAVRLSELHSKYPTPCEPIHGLKELWDSLKGKTLTEPAYLEAKAKIDALAGRVP